MVITQNYGAYATQDLEHRTTEDIKKGIKLALRYKYRQLVIQGKRQNLEMIATVISQCDMVVNPRFCQRSIFSKYTRIFVMVRNLRLEYYEFRVEQEQRRTCRTTWGMEIHLCWDLHELSCLVQQYKTAKVSISCTELFLFSHTKCQEQVRLQFLKTEHHL